MLSKHDDGRRRVAGITRNRPPSHDGGSMIGFLLMNKSRLEFEARRGN
jgi:hypothetical protein